MSTTKDRMRTSSRPGTSIAPVPGTGLPVGVHTGPLGRRMAATLVDIALPAVAAALLLTGAPSTGGVLVGVGLIVGWLLLVWWLGATRAATPGMRLTQIQVVGLRDGRPIGWGRFFLRQLVLAALAATVVGLVAMLVLLVRHHRRQGWHDLIAQSVVIKQRPLAPRSPRSGAVRPATSPPPPPAPVTPDDDEDDDGRAVGQPDAPAAFEAGEAPPTDTPPVPADQRPAGSHALELDLVPQTAPGAPVQDERALASGWFAVLDDGRELEIAGLALLGRLPQHRPGEDGAELVGVTDDSKTVSKTHLAIGVDANGLYVMDRGSTNGTTLTDTSGRSSLCPSGEVVPVPDGSIISFGDHWLRIEHRTDR